MNFVVYCLVDPRSDAVRYVGITTQNLSRRLANHLYYARKGHRRHCARWVGSVVRAGLVPCIRLLEETDDAERESYWIEEMRARGCDLTNHAPGGLVGPVGHVRGNDVRTRMSLAQRGNKGRSGQRLTADHKAKIALAMMGNRNSTGTTPSESTRNKIAQSLRGHGVTDETKATISEKLRGRKLSPERVENLRRASVGRKHPPRTAEARKKMSDKAKERQRRIKEGAEHIGGPRA